MSSAFDPRQPNRTRQPAPRPVSSGQRPMQPTQRAAQPAARSAHFVAFTSLHYQFIMVNYYHNKSIARTILQKEWNMKKLTAFVLSAMMVLSLAACGAKAETPAADATKPAEVAKLTYAVEAGSAGEEVALANGYNVVSVDSQAKALMEVQAGTADAAVLDLTLATAMIGEGTDYANLAIKDELNAEEYGVAFRKGSDAAEAVNAAFDELKADGTMQALADKYSLTLAD